MTKRIHWIDVAKGLGIIAVAMSHGMFPFHLMLDGFHMQLFFILAGYTFSVRTDFTVFLERKAVRLMIPLWFWSLFLIIGIDPGTLWFLKVLIPSLLVFYFIVKYVPIGGIALVAVVLSILFWGEKSLQGCLSYEIVRVLNTQIFLAAGYLLKVLTDYISNKSHKRRLNITSHSFNFLFFILFFFTYVAFLIYGFNKGMFNGLSNGATMLSYGNNTMFKLNYPFIAVLCMSGPFAIIFLARFINSSKILELVGKNSLVIMCTHVPILEFLNVHIASLPHFDKILYKCLYATSEYVILMLLSVIICYCCNRFFPTLTGGYKIESKFYLHS